jgi:hypothetical protein
MESLKEKRDRLAEATSELCYCVGITCSGCEANTKTLVKYGWDACQSELLPIIEEMRGALKLSISEMELWLRSDICDCEYGHSCGKPRLNKSLDNASEALARLEKWEAGE